MCVDVVGLFDSVVVLFASWFWVTYSKCTCKHVFGLFSFSFGSFCISVVFLNCAALGVALVVQACFLTLESFCFECVPQVFLWLGFCFCGDNLVGLNGYSLRIGFDA